MRGTNALDINKEDIQVKKAKLGSDDPRERAAAASDLASYGRSAAAYEDLAGDVATLLNDPSAEVRAAACNVLADMGEAGAPYVDQVLDLLGDSNLAVHRMAISALGALGSGEGQKEQVGRELVRELESEGETQALVLQSLGTVGAEPYVDRVVGLLQSQHLEVRRAALQCLGGMQPGAAAGFAANIAESLNEPLVRSYAFSALANVGLDAEGYVAEIVTFLEDGDHNTRQMAVEALGTLSAYLQEDTVVHLRSLLRHHNPAFRAAGAAALGNIGEMMAGVCAEGIKELIYDDEQWEELEEVPPALEMDMYGRPGSLQQLRGPLLSKPCCAAVIALGKLGASGQEYITAVVKQFVSSSDPDFKIACMEALADMGEKGAVYSNYIARCIKERGAPSQVRAAALLVLGEIVGRTSLNQTINNEWMVVERINTVLARVVEALTDQDPDVQVYAVHALGAAGPHAKDYIGQLAGLLEDKSSHLLATALKALGDIGREARQHAPAVAALLEDARMPVRHNAAEALGAMGAEDFASDLVQRLKDPSCDVRSAAAMALGRMGQLYHAMAIGRLLVDPLSTVRRGACVGLGRLAQSGQRLPRGLLVQLEGAQEDDFNDVRDAAREACKFALSSESA